MSKIAKKWEVKMLVGGAVYLTVALWCRKVIEEKITDEPNRTIAQQISNAFWAICYTLYSHYIVGEKEA